MVLISLETLGLTQTEFFIHLVRYMLTNLVYTMSNSYIYRLIFFCNSYVVTTNVIVKCIYNHLVYYFQRFVIVRIFMANAVVNKDTYIHTFMCFNKMNLQEMIAKSHMCDI